MTIRPTPGVTIHPAPHAAKLINRPQSNPKPLEVLKASSYEDAKGFISFVQHSFPEQGFEGAGTNNGFVDTAIRAYSEHRHLRIRPDDVWCAILSQLSLYINANAETLRKKFVSHEGQKELIVHRTGSRYTVDFAGVADEFTALMEENIVDPSLRGWIMQNFSTTTHVDRTVYAISMMASLQKFFSFECCITCGLPSVTLEGEREDWVKLRENVERLGDFGDECVEWRKLLRVVLGKFVECFDDPDAQSSKDFWNRIATHEDMGSGPSYWNGWISAFCMWGSEGKKLRPDTSVIEQMGKRREEPDSRRSSYETPLLTLDGVTFHIVDSDAMPPGWVSVPVKVNDNGNIFMTRMIAGAVAVGYESSGLKAEDGEVGLDTLRPVVGWWMFESKSREDVEREEREEEERWMEEYRKKYESKN